MNRFRAAAISAFFVYAFSGCLHAASRELSVLEYVASLDSLSVEVAASRTAPKALLQISGRLPDDWLVRVDNRKFQIDSGIVAGRLARLAQSKSDSDYQTVQNCISRLKSDVIAYQSPPSARYPYYRSTLSSILSRPDFRNVRGPTWLDSVLEKLRSFIYKLLARLFGSSRSMADVLAWSIIAIAVILIGFLAIRMISANAKIEAVSLGSASIAAAPWNASLEDARKAAENGDWREAIRLSYWTGIFFLESQGLWRPDNARTPREYLRLASGSKHHNDLSDLTRQFEAVWYGRAQAGPAIFSKFMSCLERLGCHSS